MNQLTYPTSAFGTLDSNPPHSNLTTKSAPLLAAADALQARFALRITARLTEVSQDLEPDLAERLRFAREKALTRARQVRNTEIGAAQAGAAGGGRGLAQGGSGWWFRFAAAAPVVVLVAGLMLIQRWQDHAQVSVAAEVDAALLSDDLPPKAYSDAGFAEFLKTPPQE